MNPLLTRLPALLALAAGLATAKDYHVAPTGADGNPGNAAAPFATLEKARDAARATPGPDRILVHAGNYTLDKPFVLTPADSGLVIRAHENDQVVISGGKPIRGWQALAADAPGVAESAKGKLWVADVPKGWRFHFLFVDDERQPVARMIKSDHWRNWPRPAKVGSVEPAGQLLTLAPGQLDGLPGNGDVEMNLMPTQYWNTLSVLRDIDPATRTCRRHSKNPTAFQKNGFRGHGQYNLENALKFLTAAGEWCVDSAAGKVYYWPKAGSPNDHQIWAPRAYRLVELQGSDTQRVRNVEIRGLKFVGTDRLPEDQWPDEWVKRQAELPDGMLCMEGVEDCVIEDNVFAWSGSYGVALRNYAQRVRVIRNEIAHPGCGGVLLQGYGPGTTDVNKNNVVSRNYIHDTGNGGFLHSAAITLYQSGGNEIALNWIEHVPYAGIQIAGAAWNEFGTGKPAGAWDAYGNLEAMYQVRWNELPGGRTGKFTRASFMQFLHSRNNRIRSNILSHYMEKLGDGGALYCWGCGTDNVWDGNLLRREKPQPGEELCIAIYLDDHVDAAVVRNNMCWHNMARASKTPYKDSDIARYSHRWSPGSPVLNKGANRWENNIIQPTKPDAYDARLQAIVTESTKDGGWLATPPPPPAPAPAPQAQAFSPGTWIPAASVAEMTGSRLSDPGDYN